MPGARSVSLSSAALGAAGGIAAGAGLLVGPSSGAGAALAVLGAAGAARAVLRSGSCGEAFRAGALWAAGLYGVGAVSVAGPASVFALVVAAFWCPVVGGVFGAIRALPPAFVPAAMVAVWPFLEWARGFLFAGSWWGHIALSAVSFPPLLKVAGVLGREGVAVALLSAGCGLAAAGCGLKRTAAALLGVAALVLAAGTVHGTADGGEAPVRVAAVQTWHDNLYKWRPENLRAILEELGGLTRAAAAQGARLVVWPETAVPADPFARRGVRDAIVRAARQAPVLAGVLAGPPQLGPAARVFRGEVSVPRPINLLLFVGRDGRLRGGYAKVVAFPYGEMGLRRGPGFFPVRTPFGDTGALICWENSMPPAASAYAARGVRMVAVAANLAWFGGVLDRQYLAYSRLLAAELRVPVVQAANRGISAVIGPDGKVLGHGVPGTAGVVVREVAVPRGPGRGPLVSDVLRLASALSLVAVLLGARERAGREVRRVRPGGAGQEADPLVAWSVAMIAVAGPGILYAAGYVKGGLPVGRIAAVPFLVLGVAWAGIGLGLFGPAWRRLEERWGKGTAALCAALGIALIARAFMPIEAVIWIALCGALLGGVRLRWGEPVPCAVALAVAGVLSPVWASL